jgi:hypothetical protein
MDNTMSEGWSDLVDELRELESFLLTLGLAGEREELVEDIAEIEEMIQAAGEPRDAESQRALAFLNQELLRKRSLLSDLD